MIQLKAERAPARDNALMADQDITPERLTFNLFAMVVAGSIAFLLAVGVVFFS